MSIVAASARNTRACQAYQPWPFFAQEYLRIMRSRLAMLIWAMLLYALMALPFLIGKPPPELLHALGSWLGSEAVQAKLNLFMWVDAAMNKFAVILGQALAGGIIAEERARGTLDLLAAKPISSGNYFTIKLVAAMAAFITFYGTACVAALLTFPWRIVGFDASDFVTLSAVHVFAGTLRRYLFGDDGGVLQTQVDRDAGEHRRAWHARGCRIPGVLSIPPIGP